jgi:FtsH-binding integral membrane protein
MPIAKQVDIVKRMYEKRGFLVLVFTNLLAQLGITYYIMNKTNNPDISVLPLFLAQILIILVIVFAPMPEFMKFMMFCLFSYTFGLMLSKYKQKYNSTTIDTAVQGAMSVFGVMLATGVVLTAGGINLGYKFGAFLFWSLLLLIIGRLVFVLGAKMSQANKIFSFIGIILFSMYVVYDTNVILQRNYNGGFIMASMDYYLDILNLFSNILGSNNN